MITLNVTNNKNNATVRSFLGLSRDTKPIKWFQDKAIPNGSLFYEIDTARNYMYSADDETWYYQPSNGGGGGDGVIIENIPLDDNNHMIISYSNGTTQDAGEVTISRVPTTSLYVPEGDSFVLDAGDAMSK